MMKGAPGRNLFKRAEYPSHDWSRGVCDTVLWDSSNNKNGLPGLSTYKINLFQSGCTVLIVHEWISLVHCDCGRLGISRVC